MHRQIRGSRVSRLALMVHGGPPLHRRAQATRIVDQGRNRCSLTTIRLDRSVLRSRTGGPGTSPASVTEASLFRLLKVQEFGGACGRNPFTIRWRVTSDMVSLVVPL